jgi:hypothetical protein
MNNISDTLTIGLVLVLLFGSIALYLYTRIQQSEQKINLLESILLDLKMSNEIKSYTELPVDDDLESVTKEKTVYTPYNGNEEVESKKEVHGQSNNDSVVLDVSHKSNKVGGSLEEIHDSELSSDTYESLDSVLESEQIVVDNDLNDLNDMNESKVNYDSMSLKELQGLAKTRGITGVSTKKSALIDALKSSDISSLTLGSPGSLGAGPNSFIETSASFSNAP